jgi:hypothetical protein
MHQNNLSIFDVLLQVMVCLTIHYIVGADWTFEAVSERLGFTVPLALVLLSVYRQAVLARGSKEGSR